MGFTKLDERIVQSSIMMESSDTFKVWITLLATCGANGISYSSPVFLSSVCRLPMDVVDSAIKTLEGTDPYSRTMAEDGRRIRRIDGGWEIINYKRYREYSYSSKDEATRKRLYRERKALETGHSGTFGGTMVGHSASASSSASYKNNIRGRDRKAVGENLPSDDTYKTNYEKHKK